MSGNSSWIFEVAKDCRDLRTRREASVDTENLAVNELFMRKEMRSGSEMRKDGTERMRIKRKRCFRKTNRSSIVDYAQ